MAAKLFLVGIGPGNLLDISRRAYQILSEVEVIAGYPKYVELIQDLISNDQIVYTSGMRQEEERTTRALNWANQGRSTALISSGDAGVYGLAGLALELIATKDYQVETEIVPGITAATASAALLGAPLMHDHVSISLSDILTPWQKIKERLSYAAAGDFVTTLYNPRSSRRTEQLKAARQIFLEHRPKQTPVGIVRNAGRRQQGVKLANLGNMMEEKIDMLTTVIIGSSETYVSEDKMITPRGYSL